MLRNSCMLLLLLLAVGSTTHGDERLKGIACRSVHLSYGGSQTVAFYNEVTPKKSAPGTFFMVCGWNTGYFGLQELGNGKKFLIFSVWDNARGDDPNVVDEDVGVKLLHQDPAVRVGRFGGEGTGGQSFMDFPWEVDQTYRFLVTAKPNDNRTEYTGHFYHPENKDWMKLVTFSTVTGGQEMRGFYSFIEDFKRDRKSTQFERRAIFANGWLANKDGEWKALRRARFTADANPVQNFDAGTTEGSFFLATGGDLQNLATKLREEIQLDPVASECPSDVRALIEE